MSTFFIFFISIFLTIFLIIGFHELGHFLAARWVGVRVLRFSLGFGKILFSRRDRSGTEYAFSLIPLGGYVKLLDENENPVAKQDQPFAFNRQPFWKKFFIIAAGPLFNFILALFLYWFIFMIGFKSLPPIIDTVTPHSIAAQANIHSQDEIIQMDHIPVASWMSVIIRILSHAGNKDVLTITTRDKAGDIKKHVLNLTHWQMNELKPDPLGSLGIQVYEPATEKEFKKLLQENKYGPILAFSHAWQNSRDFIWLNLFAIEKLLTGKLSLQSLGGPISIFSGANTALREGMISFMSFLAFISIAIGVINILPIPGLDGCHCLIQFFQTLLRRPIPPHVLLFTYRIGFIFIIVFSLRAILNDILRLSFFQGS